MKKKLNKLIYVFISVVLLFLIISAVFFGVLLYKRSRGLKNDYKSLIGTANKVVLFIGDGMGDNHIKCASAYLEKDIFFTSFNINGHCTTHSNALISPTDSAAAASAMATGQKFDNSEVSRHKGQNITTITELATSQGYGVGIVTTDALTGATPASFSSHAEKRGNSEEIIGGQISSNIKLFLGAGKEKYDNYKTQLSENGYTYTNEYNELSLTADKIFAAFKSVKSYDGTSTIPTLSMLTNFAIEYMETTCPQGYFLMIEGAHIDKRSHDNNIESMIKYLNDFDESIKQTYNKISDLIGTAIIVTADHETGGLRYNGETKSQINNNLYTKTGHSSANVPYYIKINPNNDVETKNLFKPTIDNTDIFRLCKSLLNV